MKNRTEITRFKTFQIKRQFKQNRSFNFTNLSVNPNYFKKFIYYSVKYYIPANRVKTNSKLKFNEYPLKARKKAHEKKTRVQIKPDEKRGRRSRLNSQPRSEKRARELWVFVRLIRRLPTPHPPYLFSASARVCLRGSLSSP